MAKSLKVSKIEALYLLYTLSLFTSMAGMELFSTLLVLFSLRYWRKALSEKAFPFACFAALSYWLVITLSAIVNSWGNTEQIISQIGEGRWVLILCSMVVTLPLLDTVAIIRIRKCIVACLIAVSFLSLIQVLLSNIFGLLKPPYEQIAGAYIRPWGLFSNTMTFSHMLAIWGAAFFAMSASLLRSDNVRPRNQFLIYAANFCIGLGVLVSLTRGAWIAYVGSCIVFGLIFHRKFLIKIILVGIVTTLCFAIISPAFRGRVSNVFSFTANSNSERIKLWKGNIEIFKSNPILGVGYRRNTEVLPKYYKQLQISDGFVGHAHNMYLQLLATTGLLGFFSYLGFLMFVFKAGVVQLKSNRDSSDRFQFNLIVFCLGGVACFLLGGITEAVNIDGEIVHLIVFLSAIVLSCRFKRMGAF